MSSTGKFQYTFNLIAKIKVNKSQRDGFDKTLEEIRPYRQGKPQKPSSGFIILDLGEESSIGKETTSIRHIYESYEKLDGFFSHGSVEEQAGNQRKVHSTDIHWIRPSILAIAGAQSTVYQSLRWFEESMKTKPAIIAFDSDFLIWIFYKHRSDDPIIAEGLQVDFISDATTSGAYDRMGRRTTVEDCPDVSQAIQTIVTILGRKQLSMLKCGFTLNNERRITVMIDRRGQIAFYSSKGTMKGSSDQERISIALMGIKRIVTAYEDWLIKPNIDKYPPGDFFTNLAAIAEKEGHYIYGPAVQQLVTDYEKLRRGGSRK